jgi:hypothetical protein
LHTEPQAPQFDVLVFLLTSHPFWALPSQSSNPAPHAVQAPEEHVWLVVQATVAHVAPQLVSRLAAFSHPFADEPSHSSVPAPHGTQAPFEHVCVAAAHATTAPQVPFAEQVCTPLPEH